MIIQSVAQITSIYRPRYVIILEVFLANWIYYLKTKRIIVEVVVIKAVLRAFYICSSSFLHSYYCTEVTIPKELHSLKKNRYVIVANHRRVIDPFLILTSLPAQTFHTILPIRFFTANVFLTHVWQRLLMAPFGCFRAYSTEGKVSGVKGGLKLSDAGQSLFIFPEGKRVNHTNKIQPKIGVAYLVQRRDFIVIPVHIDYVKNSFLKKTYIHWGKPFKVKDDIRFHDLDKVTKHIFNKVQSLAHKK